MSHVSYVLFGTRGGGSVGTEVEVLTKTQGRGSAEP
jgi:hypothetical protein